MEESRKIVLQQTLILSVGVALCTAVMVAVFAVLGYYDLSVLLGGIAGWLVTTANFFFMAVVASIAADRAQNQDVEGGKKLMKVSQNYRLLAMGAILVLCALSKAFHLIALVLPLLFAQPVLLLTEFFRKKG